jgi:hypothetical protein
MRLLGERDFLWTQDKLDDGDAELVSSTNVHDHIYTSRTSC